MIRFRLARPEERDVVENLWAYCFEPKEHPFSAGTLRTCTNRKTCSSAWTATMLSA